MIQVIQERMQTLEEKNKQMMETIFKFASSTITFEGGNSSDITTVSITNIGNLENTSNVPSENTNVVNPSIVSTSTSVAGTSTMLLVDLL